MIYELHPQNPQQRLLAKAHQRLADGALLACPTDSGFSFLLDFDSRDALERLNLIKGQSQQDLTVLFGSLSQMALYSYINNQSYRLLKRLIPGPYTFILKAQKNVPKIFQNPSKKTIGVRFNQHPIINALLQMYEKPLLSASVNASDVAHPLVFAEDVEEAFKQVDLVLGCKEPQPLKPSTVIDLSGQHPVVLRLCADESDSIVLEIASEQGIKTEPNSSA